MRYQLLALDVDGTILDPEGQIRPAVKRAVDDAQTRGMQVMLCTGRRFRSALPVAQALGLTQPLIVHNGALVKAPDSGRTLYHNYLSPDVYPQSLAVLSQVSSPMLYIDAFHDGVDIITANSERTHPFQQAYLRDTQPHCRIVADISAPPLHGIVMMSIMAEENRLHAFRHDVQAALGSQAHVNVLANKNYQGSHLGGAAALGVQVAGPAALCRGPGHCGVANRCRRGRRQRPRDDSPCGIGNCHGQCRRRRQSRCRPRDVEQCG